MDKSVIPKGMYCYDEKGKCPYWSIAEGREEQENGYCSFLGKGDYEINREVKESVITFREGDKTIKYTETYGPDNPDPFGGLLWDCCKECDENNYTDEELDEMFQNQLTFVDDKDSRKYPEDAYCKCEESIINEDDIYTCKKCKKFLADVREKRSV